jgi:hypothetical protein
MRVRTSVSVGKTSESPGRNKTSSKVSASRKLPFDFAAIAKLLLAVPLLFASAALVQSWRLRIARARPDGKGKSSYQKSGIRYQRLGWLSPAMPR